jgi:hypothetical protein
MGRYKQSLSEKGSQKWLQIMVNQCPELLNEMIINSMGKSANHDSLSSITWLSPLKADDYAEYRDADFLERLGLAELQEPLEKFWPRSGPQWDALGKKDRGEVFLVEAKAHLSELISPPSQAKSAASIELIRKSLDETKSYLHISLDKEWTSKYYQYTNRLAHLYFLRVKNNVPAYLVFLYFLGDEEVNGPRTKEEWLNAIQEMRQVLGIKENHPLAKYVLELFVDVDTITSFTHE